jgi:hypothetical protein
MNQEMFRRCACKEPEAQNLWNTAQNKSMIMIKTLYRMLKKRRGKKETALERSRTSKKLHSQETALGRLCHVNTFA